MTCPSLPIPPEGTFIGQPQRNKAYATLSESLVGE